MKSYKEHCIQSAVDLTKIRNKENLESVIADDFKRVSQLDNAIAIINNIAYNKYCSVCPICGYHKLYITKKATVDLYSVNNKLHCKQLIMIYCNKCGWHSVDIK